MNRAASGITREHKTSSVQRADYKRCRGLCAATLAYQSRDFSGVTLYLWGGAFFYADGKPVSW